MRRSLLELALMDHLPVFTLFLFIYNQPLGTANENDDDPFHYTAKPITCYLASCNIYILVISSLSEYHYFHRVRDQISEFVKYESYLSVQIDLRDASHRDRFRQQLKLIQVCHSTTVREIELEILRNVYGLTIPESHILRFLIEQPGESPTQCLGPVAAFQGAHFTTDTPIFYPGS